MSAALIELVSVGAQDVYITGDHEVSFFRQNYKRYTNLAMKPERLDYIGTFGANNEVVIPVRSKGDLMSYIWSRTISSQMFRPTPTVSFPRVPLVQLNLVSGLVAKRCRNWILYLFRVSTTHFSATTRLRLRVPLQLTTKSLTTVVIIL